MYSYEFSHIYNEYGWDYFKLNNIKINKQKIDDYIICCSAKV